MSSLMGRKTNTDSNARGVGSAYCSTGLLIAETCICGEKHGGKSSPRCSRLKQKHYANERKKMKAFMQANSGVGV